MHFQLQFSFGRCSYKTLITKFIIVCSLHGAFDFQFCMLLYLCSLIMGYYTILKMHFRTLERKKLKETNYRKGQNSIGKIKCQICLPFRRQPHFPGLETQQSEASFQDGSNGEHSPQRHRLNKRNTGNVLTSCLTCKLQYTHSHDSDVTMVNVNTEVKLCHSSICASLPPSDMTCTLLFFNADVFHVDK